MDNNNSPSRIQQIIAHLAGAATVAADGVSDAVHSAGNVVGEKYDSIKLTVEIRKLQDEQAKLFSDIGRAMFIVKTSSSTPGNDGIVETQSEIDNILDLAIEKQAEIDSASQKLAELQGSKVCPVCGKKCDDDHKFCPACGAALSE